MLHYKLNLLALVKLYSVPRFPLAFHAGCCNVVLYNYKLHSGTKVLKEAGAWNK